MEALGLDVLFMGSNATRLLQGLWVAVQISAISVVLSIILGMLFGIFMTWKNPVAKVISRLYLEIVRIMPQLVLLYIVFFGATRVMGLNISAELSSIIVFVFWGTGEMGDLVRGALTSIPKQQYESAAALGLNKAQIYRQVIIPQAIRRLIPSPHDQNHQLAADDRRYRDDEGWPTDHRSKPHDLPQRRIRHLRHYYAAVLRNLLAHQYAGKPPREEMELSNERYRPALH